MTECSGDKGETESPESLVVFFLGYNTFLSRNTASAQTKLSFDFI